MGSFDNIWGEIANQRDYRQFDVNAEWQSFLDLVKKKSRFSRTTGTSASIGISKKRKLLWPAISVAASLLALVAIYFGLFYSPAVYKSVSTLADSIDIEMKDGSKVRLGSNSLLSYPIRFKNLEMRKLTLRGQAKFEVQDMPGIPFVVETNSTAVKVLGTIFNMNSSDSVTVVENIEGQIRFYEIGDEGNGRVLNAGDVFRFDENGFHNLYEPSPPPEYAISEILNYLLSAFSDKVQPTGVLFRSELYNGNDKARVNLDQELSSIMSQLDTTAQILYSIQGCPDCYIIQLFKGMQK